MSSPISIHTSCLRDGVSHPTMRSITCLLFVLLFAAIAHAEEKKTLTIGAYNVENFFDVFDDPYTKDETVGAKNRERIELVAKSIRAIKADLVTFEELENEGCLRGMVSEFLSDQGYEYIAAGQGNSDRGINVGIISRKPIVSMTSHRFVDLTLPGESKRWQFARDLWHVEVQATPTRTLHIFAVHLKSKLDSGEDKNSAKWRLAEAVGASRIIGKFMAQNPDAWVVMMGDLNDTPESPTIAQLTGKPVVDAINTAGVPFKLIDVHADLPEAEQFTYVPAKYRSKIDYILANPPFAKRLVQGSAKHLHDESIWGGSDHVPVSATFEVGE